MEIFNNSQMPKDWLKFLSSLCARKLSAEQKSSILLVWKEILQIKSIRTPHIELDDESCLTFTWNRDKVLISIDIDKLGKLTYYLFGNGESFFEENANDLPKIFLSYLKKYAITVGQSAIDHI